MDTPATFIVIKLIVENLSREASEHELYCVFMEFGCSTHTSICRDLNGRSPGLAQVEIEKDQGGNAAIHVLYKFHYMNLFLRVYEIHKGF